jgi:hypothetical protein
LKSNTHKARVSASRSRSGRRNTHNQSSHGGARVGAGAPAGNESAKKSPPWLESYDLDTFAGVDAFTKELLRLTWIGDLGTRQSGDCLAILRLLLERRLWLPSGSEKWNPEIGRYNTPTPEKGKEPNVDSAIIELGNIDLSSRVKCEEMIQYVTALQAEGRLQPKQAQVMIQAINNNLEALKLQEGKM